MIPKKIQTYLKKIEVDTEVIVHKTVYTAYDLAKTTGLKLEQIAKTVLLKVEPLYGETKSKYIMVLLPASHQLNLPKLKKILKVKKISIVNESVMAKVFKVKAGAMTAFGPVHANIPVLIDKTLLKVKKIVARSGSFTDSLLIKGKDFVKASNGKIAVFANKSKLR
ncbi:MAG: YbaK/EbsC family protein [Patescibacteria group bacterium]|jgi:Ala-tRNA(Pro) deacylase